MLKNGLYHYQVYMPKEIELPNLVINLVYSEHAKSEACNDNICLFKKLDLSKAQLIEFEAKNNTIIKLLVRLSYDKQRDVCIVLLPSGFVKTVWVNYKNDTHKTLNRSKYVTK